MSHHERAGRSGVDRYLGMVEASGSIPDRSISKCNTYGLEEFKAAACKKREDHD